MLPFFKRKLCHHSNRTKSIEESLKPSPQMIPHCLNVILQYIFSSQSIAFNQQQCNIA